MTLHLDLDTMTGDEKLLALGDILDTLDLGDIWDKTGPVEFTFGPDLRTNRILLDPDLANEVHERGRRLGRPSEDLIHEWIRAGLASG